jgi:hydroxyacylglutathione hydrolase
MLFRLLYDPYLAHASYLIGCQRTGEAIVIDPSRDGGRYMQIAAQERLKLVAAAETHIHADFLSGSRELAEKGLKVYLSDHGGQDWNYRWLDKKTGGGRYDAVLVKNGDIIKVGNVELKVVHTPGHTPEHICFEVTDKGGGASDPMGILTGDFVFVGDLGRPDLLESAAGVTGAADSSAKLLLESARRFRSQPEYLQVWPAHGAGSACGKALGAVPQSTVGYELRHNNALMAAANPQEFLTEVLSGQPEPPLYFARMKQQNRDGVPLLPKTLSVRPMSVDDLRALDASAVVLDTRTWNQFREGHLPGAIYAPANTSFTAVAGSYIKPEDRIILLAEPEKAQDLWLALLRIGLDRCDAVVTPETLAAYAAAGGKLAKTEQIDTAELKRRIDGAATNILDVRRTEEWRSGHLRSATNIAHTRLANRLADIPKDKPLAIHCESGSRSAYASAYLERQGYKVANIAGGIIAWERAGNEVVK